MPMRMLRKPRHNVTSYLRHRPTLDTNAERDYIIDELRRYRVIENVRLYATGDQLLTENVNHYVTDGDVAVAGLIELREGPTA
jgi:hypothetical protein